MSAGLWVTLGRARNSVLFNFRIVVFRSLGRLGWVIVGIGYGVVIYGKVGVEGAIMR